MSLFENKVYGLFHLKQGILLFWGVWFLIACLTNTTNFLIVSNKISAFPFHSGNYSALAKVISIYEPPSYFLDILFTLDIFAQGLSAILFFSAAFYFRKNKQAFGLINIAFCVSMLLWAIFLIMEEIFIAYSFEATHIRLLSLEMISLLAIYFLQHQLKD